MSVLEDIYFQIAAIEDETLKTEGSFDYMPDTFHGINMKELGISLKHKNNFLKLKEIAMDNNVKYLDRFQCIRYLQRIPKVDKYKHIYECMENILTDSAIPFETRYIFFSNNERVIKLDYEIVNWSYLFVYQNLEKTPLLYKIMSCEYILSHIPTEKYDVNKLQQFLYDNGKDVNMSVNYRAECADILANYGYYEWKLKGKELINQLGKLYDDNKKNTIYSNSENAHDTAINIGVVKTIRYLIENVDVYCTTSELYEWIRRGGTTNEKVMKSYQRLLLDSSKYEGRSMIDILLLVYQYILNSQHKEELMKRLIEELEEMYETCATGHVTRIINVLSGYLHFNVVEITFEEQLKNNVFTRVEQTMKLLSVNDRGEILSEVTNSSASESETSESETSGSETKPLSLEFINRFGDGIKSELQNEFVPTYMKMEDFEKVYKRSIDTFFGF